MTAEVALTAVDRVEVLTVIDNVMDALLTNTDVAKRLGVAGRDMERLPQVAAPLLEAGHAADVPVAEHGLSFLVSVTLGDKRRTALFDTGSTVNGLNHNLRVLGVDLAEVEAIVLSHGHFDHTTGLNGLPGWLQPLPPLVLHPDFWLRRRVALPGREPHNLPTTSEEKVRAAGFPVTECRGPSLLLDGGLLVTGEIKRTTDFEQGMAVHQAFRDGEWQPDPFIYDDQALVANVRGRGMVVITGCGHAGVINTVRHARKLTGVDSVYAVIGGFHLATSSPETVIWPTIEALAEFAPEVIVPAHCTGWRATHALAAAFPDAFIQGSVGTKYLLEQPRASIGQAKSIGTDDHGAV
jgi:7,8-dihydropterin-6-yl-methyl-4-(beta-D-ribofuranosyl)aminobenzene 5'-phosphate synthase